jgi:hypothetical protein
MMSNTDDTHDPSSALAEHVAHCLDCSIGAPCDEADELRIAEIEAEPLSFIPPEPEQRDAFDDPEYGAGEAG